MKRVLLAVCLCLFTQDALAAKMHDFSLSPDESASQPDITRSNNRFDPYANQSGLSGNSPEQPLTNMPYPPEDTAKRFMDNYCNMQSPPLTQKLPGMQECLQNQRQQICELYARTSTEVQRVISDAAECQMRLLESENRTATNCDVHATARLNLMQRNWQDQNTTWALAFIPEQVTAGGSSCLPGGAK
jgi:hypothetical protein